MNKYEYAIKKMELVQDLITNKLVDEGNVIEGICGVTQDIKAITKDKKVQSKNVNYMFRSVEDAQKALNPLLPKHNIAITEVLLWHHVEEKSVEKQYQGKTYIQTSYYHLAEYMYVIQSSIDGSKTVVITMGECNESSDKGAGKTSSYAWKNMALKTFSVPVENEDEADSQNNPMKPADIKNRKATKEQIDKMVDWAAEREISNDILLRIAGKKSLEEFTLVDLSNVHKKLTEEGYK